MSNVVYPSTAPTAEVLFRAMSDRTRLRLLCLLRRGERCVCDLVAALEIPQPTVSRHLAHLRQSGLIRCRKDGLWSHYRLAAPATTVQIMLLGCLEAVAAELPEAASDERRLKISRSGCP